MDLHKALENLKFDSRMADWNLVHGIVKEEDLTKFKNSLQDLSAQAIPISLQDDDDSSH